MGKRNKSKKQQKNSNEALAPKQQSGESTEAVKVASSTTTSSAPMKKKQMMDDFMMTIDSDDDVSISSDSDNDYVQRGASRKRAAAPVTPAAVQGTKKSASVNIFDENFRMDTKDLSLFDETREVFKRSKDMIESEKSDNVPAGDAMVDEDDESSEESDSASEVSQDDMMEKMRDKLPDQEEIDEEEIEQLEEDQVKEIHKPKDSKNAEDEDDLEEDDSSDDEDAFDRQFFATPEQFNEITDKKSFKDMNLSKPLIKAIEDLSYEKPTPIQSRAIPFLLNGQDVCASASTGSGKTAAFLIPTFERLLFRNKKQRKTRVVILLPTRELAKQCYLNAKEFARYTDIRSCLVVGGGDASRQIKELSLQPDVVIATPGRLVDHMLNSGKVSLGSVEILILDEADRLIDMGFQDEVYHITKACPTARQTMLFSATMTDRVEDLEKFALKNPVRVAVDSRKSVTNQLVQEFLRVRQSKNEMGYRESVLLALVTKTFRSRVIIFVNRKKDARRLKIIFFLMGLKASELHSDLDHAERSKELSRFVAGYSDFLICTDVGSRGIDVSDVTCVINFHMPITLQNYIHRVGRTARAGREGTAVSFTSEANRKLLKKIVKHSKKNSQEMRQRVVPSDTTHYWSTKLQELEPKIEEMIEKIRAERQYVMGTKMAKQAEELVANPTEMLSKQRKEHLTTVKHRKEIAKAQMDELGIADDGLAPKKKTKKMVLVKRKETNRKQRRTKLNEQATSANKIKSVDALMGAVKRQFRRGELDAKKTRAKSTEKGSKKRKASQAFGDPIKKSTNQMISTVTRDLKRRKTGSSKKQIRRR